MGTSVEKKKLSKKQICILYFFIYAFIGWLGETAYAFSIAGYFVKRGFLYGPLCPIYGFGALILILGLSRFKKNNIHLFIVAMIVFSAFEYAAGFMLDAVFQLKWWDYSTEVLHLNARISILFSFVWGIAAILFINHVHPFIKRHLKRALKQIDIRLQYLLLNASVIILLVDFTASCVRYLQ